MIMAKPDKLTALFRADVQEYNSDNKDIQQPEADLLYRDEVVYVIAIIRGDRIMYNFEQLD